MREAIIEILGTCKNMNCSCDVKNIAFIENLQHSICLYDEDITGKTTPIRLVDHVDTHQLSVINNTKHSYTVAKIDECIIISKGTRKCDALLYSNNSFYFIEIKDVGVKSRSYAREEAIEQLEITIKLLSNIDFGSRDIYAVIGFKTVQPYVVSATKNTKRAIFKELYNINLLEGSQIILS